MRHWILPAVAVGLAAVWLVGCGRASSSDVLIEYRRSGGFAGLDDHLVIKKNGEAVLTRRSERYEFTLDTDTMEHLQGLFAEAEFSQLRREYLPSRQGSDLFEYVVTYRGRTVRTMDGAVPSSLQPTLEALNRIVQSRRRP
jgi:hypothetical protein